MSAPAEIPFLRGLPNAPALRDERRSLDNAAFANAVTALTEFLRERGVRRGDVVGAMLPNRLELVLTMFAAWRLGAAFTPVNPALTVVEAGYQLRDCSAKLVVVDAASAAILADEPVEKVDAASLPFETQSTPAPCEALDSDTALLIYTSGSTGRPKGVILDHANVAAMIRIMRKNLEFLPTDRALLVLPLFHVNALLVSLLTPLAAGGSSVILEKFDRHTFWSAIVSHEATFFSAVPAIFILLNQAPAEDKPDLSRLRFVICGAAPMPAAAISAFESRYGTPLLEGYGLTESTVGATCNPLAGPRKAGTTGVALPEMEMRILDDNGDARALGEIGEVALKGPNIMRGYLNQPEASAKTVIDGWLRTGDVGFIDADGFLTLVDRKKDMIIRGGENIYPKEIETALYTHDAVAECAVVGRADAVMGEEVIAFVALKPSVTADATELGRTAALNLAKYKHPREIRVLATLPKNPVGKIDKPALRALLRNEV
ncbi:fatty-acid-CoA ligase FadD7 [alpha proteobacterium U9-1i]|nr:fatty-acid-CoA ligase FadD7 [alpha proteobacterium U9-1i]